MSVKKRRKKKMLTQRRAGGPKNPAAALPDKETIKAAVEQGKKTS